MTHISEATHKFSEGIFRKEILSALFLYIPITLIAPSHQMSIKCTLGSSWIKVH
jgi:hypothetical protein